MEAYQGTNSYIAFCFAPESREAAEPVIAKMQQARLRVWTSKRGCGFEKETDCQRFGACRTAVILVTPEWLSSPAAEAHLKGAAALEKPLVMLFAPQTDLTAYPHLQALLSRSVRMIDWNETAPEECITELLTLENITDCTMEDGEEPEMKKLGFLGFF